MSLKVVIVDDEPLARTRLRRLLAEHGGVDIAGEAANGDEAIRIVQALRPQLVFLDVQMPGKSGFDVLEALSDRPDVIFVTAHDEFAVRAFEEQALDYLLKPVEPERLARTLARASGRASNARGRGSQDDRLERLLEAVARTHKPPRRLAVRKGAKVTLVEPESITFCRAEDKYTVLYTAEGEHIADITIEELEQTLDPAMFLRIHRSSIVNLTLVRDLTAMEGGRFLVTLKDAAGTHLHASRSGAKALREKLGF